MSPAWRLLLSGLPAHVPGVTLNRLCAYGLDAVGGGGPSFARRKRSSSPSPAAWNP